jgi:hypothetical protein
MENDPQIIYRPNATLELLRLLLIALLMFAAYFLGSHFSAVQFQNEQLELGMKLFDAQIEAGKFTEARETCDMMVNHVNTIAMYGIAFFTLSNAPQNTFDKCNALAIMQLENGTDYLAYYTGYSMQKSSWESYVSITFDLNNSSR